jgi:hypothetical protein
MTKSRDVDPMAVKRCPSTKDIPQAPRLIRVSSPTPPRGRLRQGRELTVSRRLRRAYRLSSRGPEGQLD